MKGTLFIKGFLIALEKTLIYLILYYTKIHLTLCQGVLFQPPWLYKPFLMKYKPINWVGPETTIGPILEAFYCVVMGVLIFICH